MTAVSVCETEIPPGTRSETGVDISSIARGDCKFSGICEVAAAVEAVRAAVLPLLPPLTLLLPVMKEEKARVYSLWKELWLR